MIPLDKYGWPVEQIKGRPVTNFIRKLLHARQWITEEEWRAREERRAKRRTPAHLAAGQGPTTR